MREIKFRAWNKKKNKMVVVSHLEWAGTAISQENAFLKCMDFLPDYRLYSREYMGSQTYDFELMQYTGLRDSQGKEIYEGDVVKKGVYIGEIIYEHNCFVIIWNKLINSKNYEDMTIEECEVIGNIYENPEIIDGND